MNKLTNFQEAVAIAVAEQPAYMRRKDSITATAGTILQVANLLVAFAGELPAWANILIAAVVGVAQIAVHAGTKGAITPSMANRLQAVQDSQPAPAELPTYVGESSRVN